MADTMSSQNIDRSSWDILHIQLPVPAAVYRTTPMATGGTELPAGQLTWPHPQSQDQDSEDDFRHRIW
jgi:hypothetical protein